MSLTNLPPQNPASSFASMKGHHVAVRVPDFEVAKRWYVENLDFRVIHEWPYADQHLAYIGPATDDHFYVELLGDGQPKPIPKPVYTDLGDSLRLAGYHHFCLNVADMNATIAEPRRRGVKIVTEPFELPVISRRLAFIADPFGNLIELAQVLARPIATPRGSVVRSPQQRRSFVTARQPEPFVGGPSRHLLPLAIPPVESV